jgi:hypothetical protein
LTSPPTHARRSSQHPLGRGGRQRGGRGEKEKRERGGNTWKSFLTSSSTHASNRSSFSAASFGLLFDNRTNAPSYILITFHLLYPPLSLSPPLSLPFSPLLSFFVPTFRYLLISYSPNFRAGPCPCR